MKGKNDKVSAGGVSGLSWESRPKAITDLIDTEFKNVLLSLDRGEDVYWGCFNGREEYRIGNVYDYKLVEKTIIDNYAKGIKKMTFMDVGAGNFSWGMAVAKFINSNIFFDDLEGLEVTIYSFRGERIKEETQVDEIIEGRCKNINCGMFKIEKMEAELEKRGIQIKGAVDLVVSAQCFRHLIDPVGTILQIYNQLRDNTGLMVIDSGFAVKGGMKLIFDLLVNGNFSFFLIQPNYMRNFDALVIQKSDTVHTIPLHYSSKINPRYKKELAYRYEKGSKVKIGFDKLEGWRDKCEYDYIEDVDVNCLVPKSDDNKAHNLFEDFSQYDQIACLKETKLLEMLGAQKVEIIDHQGGGENASQVTSTKLYNSIIKFIRDYPKRGYGLLQNIIAIKGGWLESIQCNNPPLIGHLSLEWRGFQEDAELAGCMIENTPANQFNDGTLDKFLQRFFFRCSSLKVIKQLIDKFGIDLNKLMGLCKETHLVAEKRFQIMLLIFQKAPELNGFKVIKQLIDETDIDLKKLMELCKKTDLVAEKKFQIMLLISKALGKNEGGLIEQAPVRRHSFVHLTSKDVDKEEGSLKEQAPVRRHSF
jgi:hypothetical protein